MTSEDSAFTADLNRLFTAALVGIHRTRWISISALDGTEQAMRIMEGHRFDVLPIESGSDVAEYYGTDKWNDYSKVTRKKIEPDEVVRFDTPLLTLLQQFRAERTHFFLQDGRGKVVGLASLVNLNCRMARVCIYDSLCHLETMLAAFVAEEVGEEKLFALTFEGSSGADFESAKTAFQNHRAEGIEAPLVEYLNLWHFYKVIMKVKLYPKLDCTRDEMERFRGINELRHRIAHPTRPLISRPTETETIAAWVKQLMNLFAKLEQRSVKGARTVRSSPTRSETSRPRSSEQYGDSGSA